MGTIIAIILNILIGAVMGTFGALLCIMVYKIVERFKHAHIPEFIKIVVKLLGLIIVIGIISTIFIILSDSCYDNIQVAGFSSGYCVNGWGLILQSISSIVVTNYLCDKYLWK